MSLFSEFPLDARLQQAIAELDFTEATEVQREVMPQALAGKDLLVSAETGSGKTLAFLVPTCQRLLDGGDEVTGIRALVLAPTRELARQILRQAKRMTAHNPLTAGLVMGGEDFKYQQTILSRQPNILVATPGRLLEHIANDSVDLSALQVLVMDEADRMLDMGFKEAVEDIIQICPAASEDEGGEATRQTMLFSATLEHRGLGSIRKSILHNPERIIIGEVRRSYSHIKQQIILADDWKHKEKLLASVLQSDEYQKAVVFTNRRLRTAELRNLLRYHKLQAGCLHGELDQADRKSVTDDLRFGRIKVLVATDVAARGLDVEGIDLVINFDVPRKGDDYVHRIGRTGRAGETGTAISFVNSDEWNNMGSIERYLRLQLERRVVKDLKAKYSGPVKTKKTELARKEKETVIGKRVDTKKRRQRDLKNKGKRRSPKT